MAFGTALTGLNAASEALNTTSNNIANASTTGFKESRAEFGSIYAIAYGGISNLAVGSGAQLQTVAQQFTQGTLQNTGNNLDVAINGQGFLAFNSHGKQIYSRAGALQVNNQGYVVNPLGQYLQVFAPITSSAGKTTFNQSSLSNLQLSTALGKPQATGSITAQMNLSAKAPDLTPGIIKPTDPSTYTYSTPVTVYDSLGSLHTAVMYFRKDTTTPATSTTSGSATWDVLMQVDGHTVTPTTSGTVADQATITFGDKGTLTKPTNGQLAFNSYSPTTGAAPLALTINLAGSTMFGDSNNINNLTQDGYASGRLSGVSIGQSGVVQANFTNGKSQDLGQIALANFNNPQGLQQIGNTEWVQTSASGDVRLGPAGSSNLGQIQSGALENSNVNLANQLVKLITEQRNYQANAKVITTAQTVTQSIINIP